MQLLKIHDNAKFGRIFVKVFCWIMNQGGFSFILRGVEGQTESYIDLNNQEENI